MGLSGQVALVTGGARGIGAAVVTALADAGAAVVVGDVDERGAIDTAARVNEEHGAQILGIGMDITDRASVDTAVATTEAEVGPLSILVNNAGIDVIKPFVDTTPDEWERIIAVNLMGLFHCCQSALEVMQPRGGAIVNFASDAGRVGSSGEAVYSATKGGVIAFTKTLAREVARYGVNVNCVCPGPTNTALLAQTGDDPTTGLRAALAKAIPLRREGEPDDIAGVVAFLTTDDASYVTGQTLSVNGGLTMC